MITIIGIVERCWEVSHGVVLGFSVGVNCLSGTVIFVITMITLTALDHSNQ